MDQIILACDEKGNFLEYIPKKEGHTGKGRRHLSITVLLYNKNDQVLLQKRKHKVFDNIWCFTGDTHLLHIQTGDETLEQATWRCLRVEYGIRDKISLSNLGTFNYFAKIDGLCENEHCAMMVGKYEGGIKMNPKTAYEFKWVSKEEFLKDFESNPQKYAPWVVEGITILKKNNFDNQNK